MRAQEKLDLAITRLRNAGGNGWILKACRLYVAHNSDGQCDCRGCGDLRDRLQDTEKGRAHPTDSREVESALLDIAEATNE